MPGASNPSSYDPSWTAKLALAAKDAGGDAPSATASTSTSAPAEIPIVVVSDDDVKDYLVDTLGVPAEWTEYGFIGICLLFGLLFCFKGMKLSKVVFFATGFLVGYWAFQVSVMEAKLLPKTIPESTVGLVQILVGLLCGVGTVSVVPLAMFCLGALCWLPFAGLAFQQLLLLEVVSEQLSSLPDGDFYGNLARWVFMSASTLVIGYLASTNSAQHALFIPATSFIGAYLICLAFNHVWLLTEGELFTPLFEIDALLKSRGDEVMHTENSEFWVLVNGLVVFTTAGVGFQYYQSKKEED